MVRPPKPTPVTEPQEVGQEPQGTARSAKIESPSPKRHPKREKHAQPPIRKTRAVSPSTSPVDLWGPQLIEGHSRNRKEQPSSISSAPRRANERVHTERAQVTSYARHVGVLRQAASPFRDCVASGCPSRSCAGLKFWLAEGWCSEELAGQG